MVERFDGEQLPPAQPVAYGRPPTPDGDRVPQPPPPAAPPVTFTERAVAVVLVLVVLAAIAIGVAR